MGMSWKQFLASRQRIFHTMVEFAVEHQAELPESEAWIPDGMVRCLHIVGGRSAGRVGVRVGA